MSTEFDREQGWDGDDRNAESWPRGMESELDAGGDEAGSNEHELEFEGGWDEAEEPSAESRDEDSDPSYEEPAPPDSPWPAASGVVLPRRPLGWDGKPQKRGLVKPDEVRQYVRGRLSRSFFRRLTGISEANDPETGAPVFGQDHSPSKTTRAPQP